MGVRPIHSMDSSAIFRSAPSLLAAETWRRSRSFTFRFPLLRPPRRLYSTRALHRCHCSLSILLPICSFPGENHKSLWIQSSSSHSSSYNYRQRLFYSGETDYSSMIAVNFIITAFRNWNYSHSLVRYRVLGVALLFFLSPYVYWSVTWAIYPARNGDSHHPRFPLFSSRVT